MRNFIENMQEVTKLVIALVIGAALTGEILAWVLVLTLDLTLGQATAIGMIGSWIFMSVWLCTTSLIAQLFGCEL